MALRATAVVVVVLAFAGCGHAAVKTKPKAALTSAAPSPGPPTFVKEARGLTLGTVPLSAATDAELLNVGNTICRGLKSGQSISDAVQVLVDPPTKATVTDAQKFVTLAHEQLCPTA